MKKILMGLAACVVLSAGVFAADFGNCPPDYQTIAATYIGERLANPHNARIEFVGDPYPVIADVSGYEGLPCWAVDVRVKARLPNGRVGGYVPYTVILYDGKAIAFKEDATRLVKA